MTVADVPAVVTLQEPGAVATLAEAFPQDRYPFPRDEVAARWVEEVEAPDIDSYVVERDGEVVGYAAARGDELLHLGVAMEEWGSGLARAAHDALLDLMRGRGEQVAWLRVFTVNGRARRFYERLGWRPTGATSRSPFPPYPELLRYELPLTPA